MRCERRFSVAIELPMSRTMRSRRYAARCGSSTGTALLPSSPSVWTTSSKRSGGALLGDRVRIAFDPTDESVFVRSTATAHRLGGVAPATRAAAHALAVAFDIVVVETVGVGQAEVEIASLADTTLVLLAPGMGDAIQAVKAGILEIADVFVVNKADLDGSDRVVRELRSMLELRHAVKAPRPVQEHDAHHHFKETRLQRQVEDDEWEPPIIKTIAARDDGIAEWMPKRRAS